MPHLNSKELIKEYRYLEQKTPFSVEVEMDSENRKTTFDAHQAQILDSLTDMVLVKGPRSRILWANQAFLKYYGMSNEQLQGIIDAPFSEPDNTQQYVRDDVYVFTTGKVLDISAEPVTRHDGVIRFFHTVKTPILDSNGKVVMTVGVSRDITEKLAADKLVSESEARFKQIFAANLVGIMVSTDTGTILEANQSFLNILGLAREEFVSGKLNRILLTPSGFHERAQQALARVQSEGFCPGYEKEFFRKDGSTVPVLVGMSRLGKDKDQIISFVLDLSESKQQERIIDEQRQRMVASSKFSALGEMSGAIAHEINNPLTVILGKAGQLKDLAEAGTLDVSRVAEAAGKIEKTAIRISKIVKSMRTFARDGEKDPFQIVHVSSLMDETLEFCNERFRASGIALTVEDFDPELTIECQVVQFSQVILNLMLNSMDAISKFPEKWIKVSVTELNGVIRLRVTDSGRGISSELREKIMKPFFTTKEPGLGTGIGLSVSKGIVECHRGSLWLDTDSPHTSFVAEIPARQNSTVEKKAA